MMVHVTKLTHSCVLVEADGKTALFDPGGYSVKDGMIRPESMPKLDYVVYTHSHGDHFNANFLKDLLWIQQPMVIGPKDIKEVLEKEGVQANWRQENKDVVMVAAPHEKLPWPDMVTPEHAAYHFMDMFTHAGDSHTLEESKAVLAIALVGPWANTGEMVSKTLELSPKFMIPIHDWHLSKEGRDYYDSRLAAVFANHKTQPVRVLDAQSVSLEV